MPLPKDAAPMLFCPFCREAFEGYAECPEHELTLVEIDRLPRGGARDSAGVTFFVDPRFGRGAVLFGAALVLCGFFMPFVGARGIVGSALEVAIDGAGNLWFTPGAVIAILGILWRRRSLQSMRAARAAVLGLAVGGALPLIYTTRRIGLVAQSASAQVAWHPGLWVMLAGLLIVALRSRKLGSPRA